MADDDDNDDDNDDAQIYLSFFLAAGNAPAWRFICSLLWDCR